MYRRHSRNSKTTKIENLKKAKEEIKETIEALYKHQSETENMINKEINELRSKVDNIKEEQPRIWKTSEKRMK
jgi:predicted  nucleic acid-binding Zn-ribbon protein